MDSRELLCAARRIDPNFQGVFARNEIPTLKRSLIFNTDKRGMPGSHWQCIYNGEFFCSYALQNPFKRLKTSMKFPVQSTFSSTCGIHCLYFIYCRKYNFPLEYTKDCNRNERFIRKWFKKKYKISINNYDVDLIKNQICTQYIV